MKHYAPNHLLVDKDGDLFKDKGHLKFEACSYTTVLPTKSDSDVILCLELLSKTQTCTLQLS